MAGDGETEVRIGSVFLASVEANKILQKFQFDPDIKIALSDKVINITDMLAQLEPKTIKPPPPAKVRDTT